MGNLEPCPVGQFEPLSCWQWCPNDVPSTISASSMGIHPTPLTPVRRTLSIIVCKPPDRSLAIAQPDRPARSFRSIVQVDPRISWLFDIGLPRLPVRNDQSRDPVHFVHVRP